MSSEPILICYDGSRSGQQSFHAADALLADVEHAGRGAELARRAGFDAEERAKLSAPTREGVVDLANEIEAAIIVIVPRGPKGVRERLEGCVSHEVAERTRRPVLVVSPNERPPS